MIKIINTNTYLRKYNNVQLIDVRSPAEFDHGHIPKAINIPLLSNDERALVGTVYKKQSKQKAIDLGYVLVEPKLEWFVTESVKAAPDKIIAIYCWRGGMRSQSFAQHLSANGFDTVYVIEKGYKAFRRFTFDFFEQKFKLKILGGYTGSGKTDVLKELNANGEQIIDLEHLANHKGSAFGAIGENPQPTVEQFQNDLFCRMFALDLSKPIWIEDESLSIGRVVIPTQLHTQMRNQMIYFTDINVEERAKYLAKTYGQYRKIDLKGGIERISKRLGSDNAKLALVALDNNELQKVALITLKYYDKWYLRGLEKRNSNMITRIDVDTVDAKIIAKILRTQ